MKMDDQRRLLKAIGREMCDVEPESLTSNFSISDSNVSFNQPGDSKMSDASSIPVLRSSSSLTTNCPSQYNNNVLIV